MSYGPVQVFAVSMASGETLSTAVDLQKAFNKISIVIPTMTSGTDVYLQGCATSTGGTYRRINHAPTTVSSVVGAQFVGSAVTRCIVPFNNVHVRYLKIELSTAMTATTAGFEIICSD